MKIREGGVKATVLAQNVNRLHLEKGIAEQLTTKKKRD